MALLLSSNLTVNMGVYRVLIENNGAAGTVQNFTVRSDVMPSNIAGTAAGAYFNYGGSTFAWSITDGPTAGIFVQAIELSHIGIRATSDGGGALYLGSPSAHIILDNLRLSLSTGGTNPAPSLELETPNITGYYSQQLEIHNSFISGGSGVLETGTGLADWAQVTVDGDTHINASQNHSTTITGISGGTFSGSGDIFLSNFNNGCSGGTSTVLLASGAFVSATPMIGASAGCTNPTTATCNSGSTGTCAGSPVTISVAATTGIAAYQACVTIQEGEFTMHWTDLEGCYYGVHTYASGGVGDIRPDGCCTTVPILFDGGMANNYRGNGFLNAQQQNGAHGNSYLPATVCDVDGLNIVGGFGAGSIIRQLCQDATMTFYIAAGVTVPQEVDFVWGSGATGSLVKTWTAGKSPSGQLNFTYNPTNQTAITMNPNGEFDLNTWGGKNLVHNYNNAQTGGEYWYCGTSTACAFINGSGAASFGTFLSTYAVNNDLVWYNTIFGEAGSSSITGMYNTFLGYNNSTSVTSGYNNTIIGTGSGLGITTGSNNSFLGESTGATPTTGNYNTLLGRSANTTNGSDSSTVCIGYEATCSSTVSTYIGAYGKPALIFTSAAPSGSCNTGSLELYSGGGSIGSDLYMCIASAWVALSGYTLPSQYTKGSCTEAWGGSGASFVLTSGDDAAVNNACYNDSGVTRTITAVKCRSSVGSNTTTVNPTFGSAGTGTTILSGALTCGNSYAYSSSGTVSNASWTTGTGIDPAMAGTLTGTSIAMIVEYTY
jgi:hypothetical protein